MFFLFFLFQSNYSYFKAFVISILDITIAGIKDAKAEIANENKNIVAIEKKLISLGISSKK